MFSKFFKIKKIEELNDLNFDLDKKDIPNQIQFDNSQNLMKKNKKEKIVKSDQKHYQGHRKRLKEKIINNNLETIMDYELLEALLMYSIPRNDVKPLAKNLINNFHTLKNIMLAPTTQIEAINGIGPNTICFFKILNEIYCRFEKEEIKEEISLSSPNKVATYCQSRMGHLKHEQFRVLFLNKKNKLIKDCIVQNGTIDRAAIFPRELILQALQIGAGSIVLVHNHPSGDPTPSKADIDITNEIKNAANYMDIAVLDHLIIAKNNYYSMKAHQIF